MNRLLVVTHMRKLRCTSKEWMSKSMKHHVLLQTGCHEPLSWENRVRVTFVKPFPSRLRYAAIARD
jgi:hypothetical protein